VPYFPHTRLSLCMPRLGHGPTDMFELLSVVKAFVEFPFLLSNLGGDFKSFFHCIN
jgi:hypothetical protein